MLNKFKGMFKKNLNLRKNFIFLTNYLRNGLSKQEKYYS